jgi:hypothetical protein
MNSVKSKLGRAGQLVGASLLILLGIARGLSAWLALDLHRMGVLGAPMEWWIEPRFGFTHGAILLIAGVGSLSRWRVFRIVGLAAVAYLPIITLVTGFGAHYGFPVGRLIKRVVMAGVVWVCLLGSMGVTSRSDGLGREA